MEDEPQTWLHAAPFDPLVLTRGSEAQVEAGDANQEGTDQGHRRWEEEARVEASDASRKA